MGSKSINIVNSYKKFYEYREQSSEKKFKDPTNPSFTRHHILKNMLKLEHDQRNAISGESHVLYELHADDETLERNGFKSNNYNIDETLERKVEVCNISLPRLDKLITNNTKVHLQKDLCNVEEKVSRVDTFFLQLYLKDINTLNEKSRKKAFQTLLDIHKLSINYILESYSTSMEDISIPNPNNYFENIFEDEILHIISPLYNSPNAIDRKSHLVDFKELYGIKQELAERNLTFQLKHLHNETTEKQYKVKVLHFLQKAKSETYTDILDREGTRNNFSRLERIATKVDKPKLTLAINKIISEEKIKHQKQSEFKNPPSIEKKIAKILKARILKNIEETTNIEYFKENIRKYQIADKIKNSLVQVVENDSFKEMIEQEVKEILYSQIKPTSLKELTYSMYNSEQLIFNYLDKNKVTNILMHRINKVKENLFWALKTKNVADVVNTFKRIEPTLKKDPYKFGKHGKLLTAFISLFSKEFAYYDKPNTYFSYKDDNIKSDSRIRRRISDASVNMSREIYDKEFLYNNPELKEIEEIIKEHQSGQYFTKVLDGLTPIFIGDEKYDSLNKRIINTVKNLIIDNKKIGKGYITHKNIFKNAQNFLHNMYLNTNQFESENHYRQFEKNLNLIIDKCNNESPKQQLEYLNSVFLLGANYLKEKGINFTPDLFEEFIYKKGVVYKDYLDKESNKKIIQYFKQKDDLTILRNVKHAHIDYAA